MGPPVIGSTPVGRVNPYQSLLCKAAAHYEIATALIIDSWTLDKLADVRHDAFPRNPSYPLDFLCLERNYELRERDENLQDFRDAIRSSKS